MTVEYTETWSSDVSSQMDDKGYVTSTAKRQFSCLASIYKVDEATVLSGLPPLGAVHPRLGVAYVLKNRSVKKKSPILWEATLTYNTPPSEDPDNQSYPWNEPAKVEFSTINETGETEVDADGDEIVTINGEAFSVSKDYADQGVTIKKAFLSYSPVAFYEFINTVNSDAFIGFPAGTLRVTGITASPNNYDGQVYYDVAVSISARRPINTTNEKAWYWRGPQKGTLVTDSGSSNTEPHLARVGGKLASAPVLVNEDGTQHTKNQPVYFMEIKIYDTSAFTGMGLF